MKITLIRHGKVNMRWKKWCTSRQFDLDCSNYDIAPLCPIDEKIENDIPDDIYVSSLKRSWETAEKLFGSKEFVETELLNEVPLKSFCDCKVPLPLALWNIVGRVQWFLQNKRQSEIKKDTIKRADALIEKLLQKNRDCVLVSHGFFMQTLIKELKRYGLAVDRDKLGFSNLERVIAVREN